MANSKPLSIYYQNARGLRTKTSTFFRNICLNTYDIIAITESWLLNGILDTEIVDERYIVFRRDREYSVTGQSLGGGVLIAVHRALTVTPQLAFHSSAEDVWVTITFKNQGARPVKLHLCVLYLCEQRLGFSFSQQLSYFWSSVGDIMLGFPNDKYLIVGDFNLGGIEWNPSTVGDYLFDPNNYSSNDEILIVDEINLLNLKQYNGIKNWYGRILDLVLSNDTAVVRDCSSEALVPIDRHHGALVIEVDYADVAKLNNAPHKKFLYNRADYKSINTEIQKIDWIQVFSSKSLDDCVEYFYSTMDVLRDNYIPVKIITSKSHPKWYSPALIKILKEKSKYHHKFKTYGNRSDEESFKMLRKRARIVEKDCYAAYIKSVENSISNNPKHFWSFIKSKSKSNAIPSSMNSGDHLFNSGETICNAFSSYFYSTFLTPTDNGTARLPDLYDSSLVTTSCVSDISKIIFSPADVEKLLANLDASKSAGPDNVPGAFLMGCAKSLGLPLYLLFKRSLDEHSIPMIWKRAYITPVHKKGPKQDITNYRPISKLCIVAKVFEKIVYNQLYVALSRYFSPSQHGFLKGRCTVSNLALLNNFVTDAMSEGFQVDVVYTDYSKAFDRIRHSILLRKLANIGIRGDLLRWFSSYIHNRSQAVVINNYISSWVTVPSGVPQGSLLGPLLFVVFVNDVGLSLRSSQLLCFADDMKIYAKITSVSDAENLQADLVRLEDYCVCSELDLNTSKCSVVTFSRKRNAIHFDYVLKGKTLQRVSTMSDLGVVHDSKLLFDTHIDTIVTKATRALGFVMRSSQDFKDAKTLKILYCSLVRSSLEYASQIWNPRYGTYISRIERVQKKFLRYLCYKINQPYLSCNYLDICKRHHILPLQMRREIADISYLLKITTNLIDCPELLSEISIVVPTKHLRTITTIHLPVAPTNYKQNSFIWRASNYFNKISTLFDLDLFNTSSASARNILSRSFFNI